MDISVTHVFTGAFRDLPKSLSDYYREEHTDSYMVGIPITNDTTATYVSDVIRADFITLPDLPDSVKNLDIDTALDYCLGPYSDSNKIFDPYAPEFSDEGADENEWFNAWFMVEWK